MNMMIQAKFEQHLHGSHNKESSQHSFESYESLVAAVETYFTGKQGRFPNEEFRVILRQKEENPIKGIPALVAYLKEQESMVCTYGHPVTIYLQLDGTTEWGNPILQTVTFKDEVAYNWRISLMHQEHLEKYGHHCYCGHEDCDFECGTMSCGCEGHCECYRYDRDYDY